MEEVRGKYVSPAIDQLAFNCPHCDALARQFWFSVHADPLKSDEKPVLATAETIETLAFGNVEEAEHDRKLKWAERMASGRPFLEVRREFRNRDVQNVSISYCFNCNQMCLWVYDQLVWPARPSPEPERHVVPNERREYEEASQALEASPRGAAALLRLAIEKLCKELGVSGESLKDDIAFVVREDVDARVQKVLDAARIIESNAGRPGPIGLGDDRATAETLSGLVNLICEKMIMEPRHLQAVYTKLREGAGTTMEQQAQGSSGSTVAGAVHSPAQPSPLFQTSGSRSPALRCGCLELDHVFRPSRGPKIKSLGAETAEGSGIPVPCLQGPYLV